MLAMDFLDSWALNWDSEIKTEIFDKEILS